MIVNIDQLKIISLDPTQKGKKGGKPPKNIEPWKIEKTEDENEDGEGNETDTEVEDKNNNSNKNKSKGKSKSTTGSRAIDKFDEDLKGKPIPCIIPSKDPTYKPTDTSGKTDANKLKKDIIKALKDSLEQTRRHPSNGPAGDGNKNDKGPLTDIELELRQSITDWKVVLKNFISQMVTHHRSWARPSKRSMAAGYYAPGKVRGTSDKLEVYICLDTSGSIGKDQISAFFSELIAMSRAFKELNINLIMWHHVVYSHVLLSSDNYNTTTTSGIKVINTRKITNPNQLIDSIIKTGDGIRTGGTAINSIDTYLNSTKAIPEGVLIFTDGVVFDNPIILPKSKNNKKPIIMIQKTKGARETEKLLEIFTKLGATTYLVDI